MQDKEKFEELIWYMQFLEQISIRIQGLEAEEEIYQLINSEFSQNSQGQYLVGLLMLTPQKDKLRVITSIEDRNIHKAEKIAGIKLSNFYIDLGKSSIYSQAVREGRTIQTSSADIMKELFPWPLAKILTNVLGLENNFPIISPIYVQQNIIGAVSLNTCHLADYLIPSVQNLAMHISAAVKFAREKQRRLKAEQKLLDMAYYDSLTRLPNRSLFMDRLKVALKQAERNNWQVGVIFLDIDDFKQINDRRGHLVGDQLLISVGQKLKSLVRAEDTVGRLGGDEFLVLVHEARQKKGIQKVAQKILKAFSVPIDTGSEKVQATLSLGIAVFPQDGQKSSDLIKKADKAMYEVKNKGKNNYQFYQGD